MVISRGAFNGGGGLDPMTVLGGWDRWFFLRGAFNRGGSVEVAMPVWRTLWAGDKVSRPRSVGQAEDLAVLSRLINIGRTYTSGERE